MSREHVLLEAQLARGCAELAALEKEIARRLFHRRWHDRVLVRFVGGAVLWAAATTIGLMLVCAIEWAVRAAR
jgi:hypothetical protein